MKVLEIVVPTNKPVKKHFVQESKQKPFFFLTKELFVDVKPLLPFSSNWSLSKHQFSAFSGVSSNQRKSGHAECNSSSFSARFNMAIKP